MALYFTLRDSTLLYHGFTSLYLTLLPSIYGSTSLYFTLHYSTLVYTHGSTSLYCLLPWLYFTILESKLTYHGFTLFYFNLLWLYFTLLNSASFYHGSISLTILKHGSTSLYLTLNFYRYCSSLRTYSVL